MSASFVNKMSMMMVVCLQQFISQVYWQNMHTGLVWDWGR